MSDEPAYLESVLIPLTESETSAIIGAGLDLRIRRYVGGAELDTGMYQDDSSLRPVLNHIAFMRGIDKRLEISQ